MCSLTHTNSAQHKIYDYWLFTSLVFYNKSMCIFSILRCFDVLDSITFYVIIYKMLQTYICYTYEWKLCLNRQSNSAIFSKMRVYCIVWADNFFRSSEKYWSYNCNNKWTGNDDFALTNVHFYLHSFAFDWFFVENDDLWSCWQSNIQMKSVLIPLNQQKKGRNFFCNFVLSFFAAIFHSSSGRFNSRTLKMLQWQNLPYYHYYYWNVIQLVHNLWDVRCVSPYVGWHLKWANISMAMAKPLEWDGKELV